MSVHTGLRLLSNGYGNTILSREVQQLSTMDGGVACVHILSRKKRTYDAMGRIKKSRASRKRDFARRQS